jgi:hypothetical protein
MSVLMIHIPEATVATTSIVIAPAITSAYAVTGKFRKFRQWNLRCESLSKRLHYEMGEDRFE